MHVTTMHHRSTAAAIAAVSSSSSSGRTNGSSTAAAAAAAAAPQLPQRRRRKVGGSLVSSSSSSMIRMNRKELLIVLLSTFVLTMIVVYTSMKFYSSYISPSSAAAAVPSSNRKMLDAAAKMQQQQKKKKKKSKSQEMKEQNKDDDSNGEEEGEEEEEEEDDDQDVLPFNEIYTVPDSMTIVGDRTDRYVTLRKDYDALHPTHQYERSLQFVQSIVQNNPYNHHTGIVQPAIQSQQEQQQQDQEQPKNHNSDVIVQTIPYDIYNCPDEPVEGYPFVWNLYNTILKNWSPDNTSIPTSQTIYHSLCIFDYMTDYDKALNYRNAELPFIVVNDPSVAESVERWNTPGYMESLMGSVKHRTEYSENNHFMYYVPPPKPQRQRRQNRIRGGNGGGVNGGGRFGGANVNNKLVPPDWKPPTQLIRMSYKEWLTHANITDDNQLGPDHPHWYYRLIGCGTTGNDGSCDTDSSEYLFDELPFFQPRRHLKKKKKNKKHNNNIVEKDTEVEQRESLYIVDPEEQKGIHCRFGMKGVIAENHFDGSRNAIVLLGGSRRYILAHPNQCEALCLYPKGHPSARHSAVDWSDPDITTYPAFTKAMGNEVVLIAGQVLYLPTEWFHYIVSLELNFQCNTRSGITKHYHNYIKQCGF